MNNNDFDAFLAISGIEPQRQEPKAHSPALKASDNFFEAPVYRGENQSELTEDERKAEFPERSHIDELTGKQNLTNAIATAGAGLTLTVTVNAVAGSAGASMGLGLGLIACLTFGVEAANGKQSGLVRLGAMGLGVSYGIAQTWNAYAQSAATAELTRAVELAEIPPQVEQSHNNDWLTLGIVGVVFLIVFCKPLRDFIVSLGGK